MTAVQAILETFKHAGSRAELCQAAIAGLQAISSYDRAMAADMIGRVVSLLVLSLGAM